MSKCPECGRAIYDYANSSVLKTALEKRLEQYGFGEGMSPRKYTSYQAVRTTIMLRLGRAPFEDTHKIYDGDLGRCMELLNEVLPPKWGENPEGGA